MKMIKFELDDDGELGNLEEVVVDKVGVNV